MNNKVDNTSLNGIKPGGALPTRTANMIFLILTLLLVLATGFNIPFIPKAWGTVIAYIPAIIVAICLTAIIQPEDIVCQSLLRLLCLE